MYYLSYHKALLQDLINALISFYNNIIDIK